MIRNRLYYRVKPLIPRILRMEMRRRLAFRALRQARNEWPILPGSERKPSGWPGWPDGKEFAVVLTHDVEGPEGLAKTLELAEIEKSLGFRSSFNFIPEGPYQASKELRDQLTSNGFEVGVHDLEHNGKLFQDREDFGRKADQINRYLKEWGAVGFRSGFMLRNLDWLHALNIRYDASTFDTDPFEPQPEGTGTIFPFWIPDLDSSDTRFLRSSRTASGYVDLPYTLPQDSTLYLLLREKDPSIWIRKLDWIAEHGGMALVNVHPDYIHTGKSRRRHTYPVRFYVELLEHIRKRYQGRYWNALPREVADHYSRSVPMTDGKSEAADNGIRARCPLNGKRAAVVLYSGFPSDPRPRRELEALLERGMSVDLICLFDDAGQAKEENIGALNVTRIPLEHKRSGKLRYMLDYARFFLSAFGILAGRSVSRRYDLVHVHNMPDFLVFTGLIPKLLGARVILDLHDPMPELYQTIYALKKGAWMVRLLKFLERRSIGFANLVLTPNEAFKQLFCSRSCAESKVEIVMNTPDENLFHPGRVGELANVETKTPKPEFRIMYHGLIAERHGLSTAVEAVHRARQSINNLVLEIYGKGNAYLDQVTKQATGLGLNGHFRYCGKRRIDDIPSAILESDLGVIPNCRTPFTEINFPTRIFEYLCLGKAVIVPRTSGIRDYFPEDSIIYFEPDNAQDLSEKICWAYSHPAEVRAIVARGQKVYEQHRWAVEKRKFLGVVEQLIATRHKP